MYWENIQQYRFPQTQLQTEWLWLTLQFQIGLLSPTITGSICSLLSLLLNLLLFIPLEGKYPGSDTCLSQILRNGNEREERRLRDEAALKLSLPHLIIKLECLSLHQRGGLRERHAVPSETQWMSLTAELRRTEDWGVVTACRLMKGWGSVDREVRGKRCHGELQGKQLSRRRTKAWTTRMGMFF